MGAGAGAGAGTGAGLDGDGAGVGGGAGDGSGEAAGGGEGSEDVPVGAGAGSVVVAGATGAVSTPVAGLEGDGVAWVVEEVACVSVALPPPHAAVISALASASPAHAMRRDDAARASIAPGVGTAAAIVDEGACGAAEARRTGERHVMREVMGRDPSLAHTAAVSACCAKARAAQGDNRAAMTNPHTFLHSRRAPASRSRR